MRYLEHRCEQMQKLGASVETIDGDAAQELSGSPAYRHGGILDSTAGTIHPLNYAYGLAQAAAAQGARLYQQSPLERLLRQDNHWLAETEKGRVTAEQVVIATNAYADDRSQGVQESTLPVFIFQCATAALPPGVFAPAGFNGRGIGPGTVMGKHLADTLVSGNRDEFPFQIESLQRESWRKLRWPVTNMARLRYN